MIQVNVNVSSYLCYFFPTFSIQTQRRLQHSIPSDMDLTPTISDDEVKELSETLQSMPSPSKPPEAKRAELHGTSIWK